MRPVFAAAAAVAACALVAASTAVAAPTSDGPTIPDLVNKFCPTGQTVVNVTQTIANDADRGALGVWAFDGYTRAGGSAYTRQINVLRIGPNLYCAATRYSGQFTTVEGPSPGGTSKVSGGRTGNFLGGYRTTIFTGDFLPTKPTSGSIGAYDYNCDAFAQCDGYANWTSWYFPLGVTGFAIARWSFSYSSGGQYWNNTFTGNSGDITG